MPITQIGTTTTDFDNAMGTGITFSYTQAAGTDRLLLVGVATEDDPTHDSVTFDGQSLIKAVDEVRAGQRRSSLWYLIDPPVTTADIVITLGSAGDLAAIAHSWQGVHQTTPVSGSAGNNGASTTVTVDVPSDAGELVIDNFGHDDNGTDPAVGAGQTELADVNVTGDFRAGSSRQDGASPNVTMSWTMTDNDWVTVGVSLQPSVPAPAGAQTHQMML